MFKGSKKESVRLLDILNLKQKRKSFLFLTAKQINLIEENDLLSIGEKLELILVSLGDKLTTEIYQNISYGYFKRWEKELALRTDVQKINDFLFQLPFPFFIDKRVKLNKKTGKLRRYVWFQVSTNEVVNYFLKKYAHQLTSIEWGVLYGYPISAIRAFGGLIEQEKHKQSSLIDYFFSGVLSRNFNKEERKYFQCWWQKIKRVSPELAKQALLYYNLRRTVFRRIGN